MEEVKEEDMRRDSRKGEDTKRRERTEKLNGNKKKRKGKGVRCTKREGRQ